MLRFIFNKSLWSSFSIFLILVPFLFAQSGLNKKGNIINNIKINKRGNQYFLNVTGEFGSKLASQTIIDQKRGVKTIKITFSNSVINPNTLSTPLKFKPTDPIKGLTLKEMVKPNQSNGMANYEVVMELEARYGLVVEKVKKSSQTTIRYLLKDEKEVIKEELAKQKELANLKLAEETRIIEEKKKQEALRNQNEEATKKKEAVKLAEIAVRETIKKFKRPSMMQVSILNGSGFRNQAFNLSIFLGKLQEQYIEESLGMKFDIINVSNSSKSGNTQTAIYFRDNFLKSALFLANLIPGEQRVIPMMNQNQKVGVDIEIFLGKDYK